VIELKAVSGGYGSRNVISNVSVAFPKGEITAVIGANGCGKSTLLMMCAGLLPISKGEILVGREALSALSRNQIAKRISYLSQSQTTGNLSVQALVSHGRFPYLGYPRKYSVQDREQIQRAMCLAGVEELSHRLMSQLSGGQQQRARIAMMLAQDTPILLLDEPLTYLDIRHQLELMELIQTLKSIGKTVIVVMHDLNLALTYADRVAVMKQGEILAFDTPQKIAEGSAIAQALGVKAVYSKEFKQYFFNK